MRDLVIKKCLKCEALVEVLKDCDCNDCGIQCCGEKMKTLEPNTVDAAFEKHVPNYEVVDNQIIVTVNHVMEEEHYIKWIALVSDCRVGKKILNPGDKAIVTFPYIKDSKIYAYCNKHELWSNEVK